MSIRTVAILLIVVGCQAASGDAQRNTIERVQLTLARQTPWQGADGWCRFSLEVSSSRAGIGERCGPGNPVDSSWIQHSGTRSRLLTDAERRTALELYDAARLFDGGHIGADFSASDLGFEMLIVRTSQRAAALVTLGNPTFASGPRKALIDWIRQRQMELQKLPVPTK
jgi:hypothetical protein